MKVAELKDENLDYWVAKAEGKNVYIHAEYCFIHSADRDWHNNPNGGYSPSTDWAQGGPIIEREDICLSRTIGGEHYASVWPETAEYGDLVEAIGKTKLEAAMRCYVASKFGEEVPDET